MSSINRKIKFICFLFTTISSIPENNKWWGKGFTEWTNVAQAKPLFKGHHQPNIPKDLGFYDFKVRKKAELIKQKWLVNMAFLAFIIGITG